MQNIKTAAAQLAANLSMRREIITTLPIIVFVINIESDDVIQQIELDYAKIDDKKLLGRLSYWALTNGCYMELMNKKDVDKETISNEK